MAKRKAARSMSDRADPRKNKSLAIRTILERMPSAKASEVVAEVKKEFGHTVGLNQVYMARSKAAAAASGPAKRRRRRRRRLTAASPARNNGRAAASPAAKWVEAIKLARQLLKATGGSESAVAIIKAVEE